MSNEKGVIDPTMQSLGEIAYIAYCNSVGWKSVKGDPLPSWNEQRESLKAAWHAAAGAVAEACGVDKE